MKFANLLLPLLVISCSTNHSAKRNIASEDLTLPVKMSFSSQDKELKEDGVFPIMSSLSYLMSNLDEGPGSVKLQVSFPTNKADVQSVKLKRVFLFADRMESKQKIHNMIQKIMLGDKTANLKFLREFSVRIEPSQEVHNPQVITDVTKKDIEGHKKALSPEGTPLVKFDSKSNSSLPLSNIYLFKSQDPKQTKRFIDEVISDRSVNNFEIIDDVVVVELKNDPIISESFRTTMSNYSEKLEQLGVTAIDQCTKDLCIDFQVSDTDLAPLLKQHDALTLEAFLKSYIVPNSMKLRGQVEFEVKLNADY